MAKYIIQMDEVKSCDDCKLRITVTEDGTGYYKCAITDKYTIPYTLNKDCPLKKVEEK